MQNGSFQSGQGLMARIAEFARSAGRQGMDQFDQITGEDGDRGVNLQPGYAFPVPDALFLEAFFADFF